jgi:hypothetical protein
MSPQRPCVAAPVQAFADRWRAAIAVTAVLVGAALLPGSAGAQTLKPWVPPSADSLVQWASEAKARFQQSSGDTVGGANLRAYELVGTMGRRLVRSLGRQHLLQAPAVGVVLDSMGLDVDVVVDPKFPQFVLLMVRNPYRLTAHAVGYLYWYRESDLRMQGAMFYGGHRPEMRVWWTGYPEQPYSMGVIDHDRDRNGAVRMTLFRLEPAAAHWDLRQYPQAGVDLPGAGEASWVDVNGDDRPELVAWMRAENDTLFEACANCPFIIHELTYTESRAGMRLHDLRVFPSPYATFTLFVRLLTEGNRAAASRLLRDPAKVDEAIAAGWGSRRRARSWMLEYAEDERWPRWLAFIHRGPRGDQRYVVHFELKEGRWIISRWLKPRPPGGASQGASPDSAAASPGRASPVRPPAVPGATGGSKP